MRMKCYRGLRRRSIPEIAIPLLILFLLSSDTVALAQNPTGEFGLGTGKVQITADKLIADSKENSAEFRGNVKAVQQDTIITSDRLKIYFKKEQNRSERQPASDAIERIEVIDNVEIKFDKRVAVTKEAVYITDGKRLVLKGPNTTITSGKDTITGEKITLFRETGRIQVEGGKASQVEAIIYPGEKN